MNDVDMTQDWLSVALTDDAGNQRTASTNRALIAVKHRTEKRFARYLKGAQSKVEFDARLGAIDDELHMMANEVAIEHSAPEPDKLYEAALKHALGFGAPGVPQPGMQQGTAPCPSCGSPLQPGAPCPNCAGKPGNMQGGMRNNVAPQQMMAAEVPSDGQNRRSADPDEKIGDTPASSAGESYKYPKTEDKLLDESKDNSKLHPRELQDVTDRPETRKDWNNPGAGNDGFGGTPPVDHKVDVWNLAEDNQFKEQTGPATSTFGEGDNAEPVTKAADPVLGSTRQWHILEG